MEAQVIFFLHEKNAYDVGIEEKRIISEIKNWHQMNEGEALERDDVMAAINFLYKINIVNIDNGVVYLKEKVFGKVG